MLLFSWVNGVSMGKIMDFIKENGIKPKECDYHTNRTIKSKLGKPTGNIRVLAYKGNAMVEYTCPECEHKAYTEQEWKKPFAIKCEKCGHRMPVGKLRAQAKREAKAEAKAREKSGEDKDEGEEVSLDD